MSGNKYLLDTNFILGILKSDPLVPTAHFPIPIPQNMTDIAIRVSNLSKCYQIYDTPRDRLKQFVVPKLCRAIPALRRFSPTFHMDFWALNDLEIGQLCSLLGRNTAGKLK